MAKANSTVRQLFGNSEQFKPKAIGKSQGNLCEPKRANDMTDDVVLAKAQAAATWCTHATAHAGEYGGKPWTYLLIPHDQIQDQMTLGGLAARCKVGA